jgi:nucleoside 2-deoxyribosyltransferase
MGYTLGSGKPVFGYYDAVPFYGQFESSEGSITYQQKVHGHGFSSDPLAEIDMHGLAIEKWGFSDNLMLLGTLDEVGYPQRTNVYDSCADAVDWMSKHCLKPGDCLEVQIGVEELA